MSITKKKTNQAKKSNNNHKQLRVGKEFWGIFIKSIKDFRRNAKILIGIVMVAALPAALLALVQAQDSTLATYLSIFSFFMTLALIWGIAKINTGNKISIKQAYYEGTSNFIKFILVALVLALQFIPFAVGATILINAIATTTIVISAWDWLILGTIWLVLAMPTFYWLSHYVFSIFEVGANNLTPISALRTSKTVTKGRGFMIFGHFLLLLLSLILVTILPSVLLIYLYILTKGNQIFLSLLQLVSLLIILPIFYLYLQNFYQYLKTNGKISSRQKN